MGREGARGGRGTRKDGRGAEGGEGRGGEGGEGRGGEREWRMGEGARKGVREVGGGRGGIRVVQDKCSLGRLPPTFAMSTAQTVSAKDFWTTARSGNLTPWSLAKVYAFHKVSALKNLDLEHTEIAKMVTKVGGGHPCPKAIQKLRKQFDENPEWYPGKGMETRKRPGPKPLFSAPWPWRAEAKM